MLIRTHNIFKSVGATCLAGALALGGLSGCEQQGASCATAHGAFAVKLSLKSGEGACAESVGGVFGLATYNYPTSDGRPDFDRSSMAIQAEEFGLLVGSYEERTGETPDPDGTMYAKGDFAASEPNGNGVCEVPTLAPASKDFPALEAIPAVPDDPETPDEDESAPEVPAEPAMSVEYAWSNLRFLVSEANQGTRFTGTLKYTVDDCEAEYDAVGLYPAVFCGDEEGNPVDGLCSAEPIADLGMVIGSGISPDFVTKCDPVLLLCVLAERPPTD